MNSKIKMNINTLFLKNFKLICLAIMVLFAFRCHASQDYVTITLPEEVIRQSIQKILPVDIGPRNEHMEGNLVLDSIDRFELGDNSAQVHGLILGKDIVLNTRIGDQDLRFKVGEVQLPVTCDLTFRFDQKEKKLYVTPHFAEPVKGTSQEQGNKVLPILALLNNREYPVSFSNLQGMQTKIGQRQFSVAMEPVDIQISKSQLVLKMVPKLSKTN